MSKILSWVLPALVLIVIAITCEQKIRNKEVADAHSLFLKADTTNSDKPTRISIAIWDSSNPKGRYSNDPIISTISDSIVTPSTGYKVQIVDSKMDIDDSSIVHMTFLPDTEVARLPEPKPKHKHKRVKVQPKSILTEDAFLSSLQMIMRPIDSQTIVLLEDSLKVLEAQIHQLKAQEAIDGITIEVLQELLKRYQLLSLPDSIQTIFYNANPSSLHPLYIIDSHTLTHWGDTLIEPKLDTSIKSHEPDTISHRSSSSTFRQDSQILRLCPNTGDDSHISSQSTGHFESMEHLFAYYCLSVQGDYSCGRDRGSCSSAIDCFRPIQIEDFHRY